MFERFTPQSRTVVVMAQEEARALGHPYIGTEHLLLALLADPQTGAAHALTALGADQGRVREEVLAMVGPGEGAPSGHIPFTPRSKKVLELSLREALALKHRTIEPEHILLGLVREGEGLAAQILTKHGLELKNVRQQAIARLGGTAERPGQFGRRVPDPRLTAMTAGGANAADRALDRAGGEAVASFHYLLALLDDEGSAAARVLAALGVTPEAVEAKLAELGTAGTNDEPPAHQGARRTRVSVEGESVRVELAEPDLARRLRPFLAGPVADLPGIQAVWAATLPALTNVVNQLEAMPTADPPGWSEAGVAALAVTSLADGPATRLWVRPGHDRGATAASLAGWLRERGLDRLPGEANYLTVAVHSTDPDVAISGFSMGIAADRPSWPLRPIGDLVAAALDVLHPSG